jgi:hypothetical protein
MSRRRIRSLIRRLRLSDAGYLAMALGLIDVLAPGVDMSPVWTGRDEQKRAT